MTGPSPDLTPRTLRKALKAWNDANALGGHPLAAWDIVTAKLRADGFEDGETGRGLALRTLLREAIESFAPPDGEAAPDDRRWRPYLILKRRYIDQISPGVIADQLAVARSTYNHEQLRAEEALAARLIEWAEQGTSPDAGSRLASFLRTPQVPFMAPPRLPKGLVGRDELISCLRQRLCAGQAEQKLALHGLPGVGKSALAVEIAHDDAVRETFPDGVLWLGLGLNPDHAVLLSLLASALGLHMETYSALERFEDRLQMVHGAIGSRRMIIVLDDVWKAGDALAFQLGGPNCATIITTRLPVVVQELSDYSGMAVPELDRQESLELLEHYAPGVVQKRGAVLGDAVDHLGGIPLSLVIVGGYLRREAYAGQPRRLAEAIRKLRELKTWGELSAPVRSLDQRPGLDADQAVSLFGVIAMSEAVLDPAGQGMLKLLAYLPPKPATFHESVLLEASGADAAALDSLIDAGLVEAAGHDRLRVHGAIVQYARSQEPEPVLQDRIVRAVQRYLEGRQASLEVVAADAPLVRAALDLALEEDLLSESASITHMHFHYQARMGLYARAVEMLDGVLKAIENQDMPAEKLQLMLDLGSACQRLGSYERAQAAYDGALRLAEHGGPAELVCAARQGQGSVAYSQGDFLKAEAQYRDALEVAEEAGLVQRQAGLVSNLGMLAVARGALEQARDLFERGLALARESGDENLMCMLLSNLGTTHARRREYASAEDAFSSGLELAEEDGDRAAQAALMTNLGTLAHEQGKPGEAEVHFKDALELARQMDDAARVCQLLANLAALSIKEGALDDAERMLKEGLAIAERIGHREHQILLIINLAEWFNVQANREEHSKTLADALCIAEAIGHRRYIQLITEMMDS